jgi:hypothetical protein
LRLETLVPMNIEVPTKYPLSQERIVVFLNICPQQKPDVSQTNAKWNVWVSLEERSRPNSPRQRFHSQLFYKIVRYFCRTLYNNYLCCRLSCYSIYWKNSSYVKKLCGEVKDLYSTTINCMQGLSKTNYRIFR